MMREEEWKTQELTQKKNCSLENAYHNLLNMASAGSGKNSDTITFQTKHSLAHN
jgi:hypothetical protein